MRYWEDSLKIACMSMNTLTLTHTHGTHTDHTTFDSYAYSTYIHTYIHARTKSHPMLAHSWELVARPQHTLYQLNAHSQKYIYIYIYLAYRVHERINPDKSLRSSSIISLAGRGQQFNSQSTGILFFPLSICNRISLLCQLDVVSIIRITLYHYNLTILWSLVMPHPIRNDSLWSLVRRVRTSDTGQIELNELDETNSESIRTAFLPLMPSFVYTFRYYR